VALPVRFQTGRFLRHLPAVAREPVQQAPFDAQGGQIGVGGLGMALMLAS
jgi:hypothetical protein